MDDWRSAYEEGIHIASTSHRVTIFSNPEIRTLKCTAHSCTRTCLIFELKCSHTYINHLITCRSDRQSQATNIGRYKNRNERPTLRHQKTRASLSVLDYCRKIAARHGGLWGRRPAPYIDMICAFYCGGEHKPDVEKYRKMLHLHTVPLSSSYDDKAVIFPVLSLQFEVQRK